LARIGSTLLMSKAIGGSTTHAISSGWKLKPRLTAIAAARASPRPDSDQCYKEGGRDTNTNRKPL